MAVSTKAFQKGTVLHAIDVLRRRRTGNKGPTAAYNFHNDASFFAARFSASPSRGTQLEMYYFSYYLVLLLTSRANAKLKFADKKHRFPDMSKKIRSATRYPWKETQPFP